MQKHIYKNKQHLRKAFTLIELLIVIAIIGILFIVLISKVDFATDKAKATGVQTDFRSFQLAFQTVAREHQGFSSLIDENYEQLEIAINKNLDNKLKIDIDDDGMITMANGATDPWNVEYHGKYVTGNDSKDRGALVMYSNGADLTFGSAAIVSNGVISVSTTDNAGKDDYSITIIYSLKDGYGQVNTNTTGFGSVEAADNTINGDESNVPGIDDSMVEENVYGLKLYQPYEALRFDGNMVYIVFTENELLFFETAYTYEGLGYDFASQKEIVSSNIWYTNGNAIKYSYEFIDATNIRISGITENGFSENLTAIFDKTNDSIQLIYDDGSVFYTISNKEYHPMYEGTTYNCCGREAIHMEFTYSNSTINFSDSLTVDYFSDCEIDDYLIYGSDGYVHYVVSMDGKALYSYDGDGVGKVASCTGTGTIEKNPNGYLENYSWHQIKDMAHLGLTTAEYTANWGITLGQTKDGFVLVDCNNYGGFVFMANVGKGNSYALIEDGVGGYADSQLAADVESYYATLWPELQNNIKRVTVKNTNRNTSFKTMSELNCHLFIPSISEVGGSFMYTEDPIHQAYILNEGVQFDYFQTDGFRASLSNGNHWLLRSWVSDTHNQDWGVRLHYVSKSGWIEQDFPLERELVVTFVVGYEEDDWSYVDNSHIPLNQYTWDELKSIAQLGLTAEEYQNQYGITVGQVKDGKYWLVDIDGNEYGGFVFMYSDEIYKTYDRNNSYNYDHNYVESLFETLDTDLKTVIKVVDVEYYNGTEIEIINDTHLFLASHTELGLQTTHEEGSVFELFVKGKNDSFYGGWNIPLGHKQHYIAKVQDWYSRSGIVYWWGSSQSHWGFYEYDGYSIYDFYKVIPTFVVG